MKSLLVVIVVIAIAVAGLGFWRGWFDFGSKREQDKVQADLNVNVAKFKQDKDAFKKQLTDRSRALKEQLAGLEVKAKKLTGDAKAKAEKEIEALTKRHQKIETKAKEVDEITEESFEGFKDSLKRDLHAGKPDEKD